MTEHVARAVAVTATKATKAKHRLAAWCRVLDAVGEMRAALDHQIWREDPDDCLLEADVQCWCELARALADFLSARRMA